MVILGGGLLFVGRFLLPNKRLIEWPPCTLPPRYELHISCDVCDMGDNGMPSPKTHHFSGFLIAGTD